MTILGMFASAFTSYALGWRLLRFTVDILFFISLLMTVATPAAMGKPPPRPPATTWRERLHRALQIAGEIVLRVLSFGLAAAILVGLITSPSSNAAIVIWRICTAFSAAIVLNSRLLNALWNGGPSLRLISSGIACIEIVAFIATLSIDIPAILQSADLVAMAGVAQLTSQDGLPVPPEVAAAVARNHSGMLSVQGNRIVASPVVADIFHYLGVHPFRAALDEVLAMPRTHQNLSCAITSGHDAPTSGYRSQRGVVDYVLPTYVRCSPGLDKLVAFVAGVPAEATPAERDADVRRCGSVIAGAAADAILALSGHPDAQDRIRAAFPCGDQTTTCCTSRPLRK